METNGGTSPGHGGNASQGMLAFPMPGRGGGSGMECFWTLVHSVGTSDTSTPYP